MKKNHWGIAVFVMIFCFTVPTLILAADCDTLKKQIQRERNLLKKRKLLEHALETCTQDAEIHYLCAYTAERLRKYDKALTNYLKAIELDSHFARAYFGMGDIYMVLGNAESAIWAYTTGLEIEPDSNRARSALDLAQIKHKAATGEDITTAEFIRVMEKSKKQETTEGAIDGPLLRMQIHFVISSATLSEKALAQLAVVGKALESTALKNKKFEISGHTDKSGSQEANLLLSKQRAEEVRNYLIKNFDIEENNLVAVYYGDTRPASPNDTPHNRAQNRRVEFKRLVQ